ncbi:hypothetical protein [Streptomyces sp. NPDC058045]|uniref:hypothetical protein n=1 Tax=Streptomyces sp. NPDC058045 TaxID=3346311 RepID=UPI0036E0A8FE
MGPLHAQVRASGEPDEAKLVEYLDVGHRVTDFMEAGFDVLTGEAHRHTPGCSSLVTYGFWVWRADFAHYLEAYHVPLPGTFATRVRGLNYRMPPLVGADFAPLYEEILDGFGMSGAGPWDRESVRSPWPRLVPTRAEFLARARRERPAGRWGKSPRKLR